MYSKKTRLLVFIMAIVGILVIAGCSGAGAGDDTNGDANLGDGPDGGPAAVSLGSAAV